MDSLTRLLSDKDVILSSWSSIHDPYYLALLANSSFDAITLDMQHGVHTEGSILRGLQILVPSGKPVIVRIPVGRFDFASRALDAGAHSIIAPMINNESLAKEFVSYTKYLPVGDRSYGPAQACLVHEIDRPTYLRGANEHTYTLAMIETREGVESLDSIASSSGIDGLFCGPGDLSLSYRDSVEIEPFGSDTIEIVGSIAKAARSRNKVAATFCMDETTANIAYDLGYNFIAMGFDGSYIGRGIDSFIDGLSFR